MKASAPSSRASKGGSRARSSLSRKSRQSFSAAKDTPALESLKIKWSEIIEEEGGSESLNIVKGEKTPRFEAVSKPSITVLFDKADENPIEIQFNGDIIKREILKSICSLYSSYATVTVLRLIDCKLKTEGIKTLGDSLSESCTLKQLYLDLNPIDGGDYSPLLSCDELEVLSLKGCAISGRGAELISEKLSQQHIKLRVLMLNTNLIDDKGATALATSLKWNDKLVLLSLAGNNIGTEGAKNLFSILKEFFLDDLDLKKRRNFLFMRAQQIMIIVNERKESYLSSLPPMPALPSAYSSQGGKSRRDKASKGTRKKSESKVMSKSQRLPSNNGERSMRRSAIKNDKGKSSDQASLATRSYISEKHPRSTYTAMSGSIETTYKVDHEGDNETQNASDDDSINDFSRFEDVLTQEWDRQDNLCRYKEKMLKKLCQNVANELFYDPAFHNTFLSRVFVNPSGKLCSRGNLSLSHLNLAYNKIRNDVMMTINDMLSYHEKVNRSAPASRKGIKVLMLEGNLISPHNLLALEMSPTLQQGAVTSIIKTG